MNQISTGGTKHHPSLRLGTRTHYGPLETEQVPIVLDHAARTRHCYLLGVTGTGKSTLQTNMLASDLQQNAGLALIDLHGDLAADVAALVPRRRTDNVCFLQPANLSHPVSINPLAATDPAEIALQAANLTAAFRHAWASSWGPRLDYILNRGLHALIEANTRRAAEDAYTLTALARLFSHVKFRNKVLADVHDPMVLAFFRDEFEKWPPAKREESLMPLQNKIGALLSSPALLYLFGQPQSSFDMTAILDRQQILLADLNKTQLGESNAALVGAILVTMLTQAAMSRAKENRKSFAFYIDEFQNIASGDTFPTIFSEARKWNLSLTVAHQNLAQIPEQLKAGVLSAGTVISFRCTPEDAAILAPRLQLQQPKQLVELANWKAQISLLENNEPSMPYELTTPPPPKGHPRRAASVMDQSRRQFGRPRKKIDKALARFFATAG